MNFSTSNRMMKSFEEILRYQDSIPFHIKRGKGAYIYDYDQNKWVDFYLNRGSLILGHAHPLVTKYIKNSISKGYQFIHSSPLEYQLAKLVMMAYPMIESIRFQHHLSELLDVLVDNVQESTGKGKVLYLGTNFIPHIKQDKVIICPSDTDNIERVIVNYLPEIGGVCIEPVETYPEMKIYPDGFLKYIQDLCIKQGILFILNEMVTGFRMSKGGGVEYYQLNPDLILLGGILGGGFPLYAVGGRKDLIKLIFRKENCYSPFHYVAGIETLKYLYRHNPYSYLNNLIRKLLISIKNNRLEINGICSMFSIKGLEDKNYWNSLIEKQFFLMPPLNQCHFLSVCHNDKQIANLIKTINNIDV